MLMLAGVVHSVDLGHAVGQVAEETRSDLGVYTFAGGQEPGDFIHALAETGAIFSQDGGVGVQGRCRGDRRVSPGCSHAHLCRIVTPVQTCSKTHSRVMDESGDVTYQSSEPSGGSGDASQSSPGCPLSPV